MKILDIGCGNSKYKSKSPKDSKMNFKIKGIRIHYGVGKTKILNKIFDPFLNLNHKIYCRFFAWIFPAAEIEFELEVLKK